MGEHDPVIAVDFDDTLIRWTEDGEYHLRDGAPEALRRLKEMGYSIVIYTCRIGLAKGRFAVARQVAFIEEVLDRFDIPYDSIFMGPKLVADFYVDDRAVEFKGDWNEVVRKIEERGGQ